MTVTKPFAVPGSRMVVDYHGDLWTITGWAENYTPTIQWISASAFTAIINFTTKEVWDPVTYTGVQRGPFTGTELMTKSCVAP